MEMDKEKRVPPDRQKEAEQQLPPEVEAKMNELSPKAFAIADQTIAAYGKPVEEYDDIDRATMAGLIFGEICALAYENGFARLGWFNGTITAIAYQKLHYSVRMSVKIANLLVFHSGQKENPDMNTVIHTGIDAYFPLDKPEEMSRKIKVFFAEVHEAFEKARRDGLIE